MGEHEGLIATALPSKRVVSLGPWHRDAFPRTTDEVMVDQVGHDPDADLV